jgi:hypothetical protein
LQEAETQTSGAAHFWGRLDDRLDLGQTHRRERAAIRLLYHGMAYALPRFVLKRFRAIAATDNEPSAAL